MTYGKNLMLAGSRELGQIYVRRFADLCNCVGEQQPSQSVLFVRQFLRNNNLGDVEAPFSRGRDER